MVDKILEIQDLRKTYGKLEAVQQLTLQIPKGSVFGLLGPNGSGKTTTLGMVLGVIKPDSGSFRWFGKPLDFNARQKIGAILETPNFYPYLTARQNLKLVAEIKEIRNPRIDEVLELVALNERADSRFKTFSLGMKQRLAIASALLCNPQVLLLDEPTNGLDPQGIVQIRNLIKEIAQSGITIILASHLLSEIEKVCTHAAVLQKGKLLFTGTVAELTGHEGMIEIQAENQALLEKALQEIAAVAEVRKEEELLLVMLAQAISPAELNRELASKGIYASHLVFRKTSLEQQFLNLIKS